MNGATFRTAINADAPALVDIYNHYVLTSNVTFDLDPWSAKDMAHKIETVAAVGMPFIVAEHDGAGQFERSRGR